MVYAVLLTVMNSNSRGHAGSHFRGSRSSSSYYRQSTSYRRQKNRMRGALSRSQSAAVHPIQEPPLCPSAAITSCGSFDSYMYPNQSGLDSEDDTEESIGMMPISYYTDTSQQQSTPPQCDTIGECDTSTLSNSETQAAAPRSRWRKAMRWVLTSLHLTSPSTNVTSLPAAEATPLPVALPFADRIRRFSASSDTEGAPTAVVVTASTYPYR